MPKNDLSASEREAFAIVGRIGGKANFKKHGRDHMRKISKKAVAVHWGKKKKSYRPKV